MEKKLYIDFAKKNKKRSCYLLKENSFKLSFFNHA